MNQEAIDILDTHLYGQYAPGTAAVKAYWESLYEQLDGVGALSDVALTAHSAFFRLGLKSLSIRKSSSDACRSAAAHVGHVHGGERSHARRRFSHRRLEPVGLPLSVHVYFYDDHFQGYLVRQAVQAVGSKVREELEVWAVPQSTFVLETNLKEFERLKAVEVCIYHASLWLWLSFLLKVSEGQ